MASWIFCYQRCQVTRYKRLSSLFITCRRVIFEILLACGCGYNADCALLKAHIFNTAFLLKTCSKCMLYLLWVFFFTGSKILRFATQITLQNVSTSMLLLKQHTANVNSLAPGRYGYYLKSIIFKLTSRIDIVSISCAIALRWISQGLTYD